MLCASLGSLSRLFSRAFALTVSTLEVSAFRCKFHIEKTLKPEPNKALIEIYNLSADHRAMLSDLAPGKTIKLGKTRKKGVAKPFAGAVPVSLSAGYQDPGPDLIYLGDLVTVDSEIDGGDWVTAISSGDGARAVRTARINQAFGPKTPVSAALRTLVKSLGLGEGNLGAVVNRLKLQGKASLLTRGLVMSGPTARMMTDLCRSADLEWSIQDGAIQFVDFGQTLAGQAVILQPGTGLIGSPNVSAEGIMNCKTLIVPGLRCGGVVVLKSALVDGQFRIEKIAYTGDTHGQDWTAEIWAKRY
jgi:hypothetical protein